MYNIDHHSIITSLYTAPTSQLSYTDCSDHSLSLSPSKPKTCCFLPSHRQHTHPRRAYIYIRSWPRKAATAVLPAETTSAPPPPAKIDGEKGKWRGSGACCTHTHTQTHPRRIRVNRRTGACIIVLLLLLRLVIKRCECECLHVYVYIVGALSGSEIPGIGWEGERIMTADVRAAAAAGFF